MRPLLFLGILALLCFTTVVAPAQQHSKFQPDMRIATNSQVLRLHNYHPFAYRQVRVVLNQAYRYSAAEIAPGTTLTIPWSAFVPARGPHLPPTIPQHTELVDHLVIYVENAAGDYGTIEMQRKPRL